MYKETLTDQTDFIRAVTPAEAAELSALCNRIYPQHFAYLWTDGGAWYQAKSYSESVLKAELDDANVRYFFAVVDHQPVGYLKVKIASDLNDEPGGLEVERIYFSKEVAGRGLGKQLIERAFEIARQQGKRYVWLHVMDSSTDSIAFYHGRGFDRVGETHLPYQRMKPAFRRMWQFGSVSV